MCSFWECKFPLAARGALPGTFKNSSMFTAPVAFPRRHSRGNSGHPVFLFEGAVDMCKGFEGLSALVRDKLGEDPTSGHLFVFSNAARNQLKVLFWDGSGLWVCGKRLERSRFCWPSGADPRGPGGKWRLSAGELAMLLDGLDFGRAQKRRWWRKSEG